MAKYDINDPTDIAIMNAEFDAYSFDDWANFLDKGKQLSLSYDDIGKLIRIQKKARLSKYLSAKQVLMYLGLIEKINTLEAESKKDKKSEALINSDAFQIAPSHVTLRVAWHDNKWNGSICKDPKNNTYCNGFHSLLSERIRKRKEDNIENEIANSGKFLDEIEYLPPCFWSVNLFGERPLKVQHDNPAAPGLTKIKSELPPNSMYSWPFAVSFTRTPKEQEESGAYPKNLESVRIPRFNSKLQEGKSIAFMYAKFSNPITEEDQQYLVIGAGLIFDKEKAKDIPHFGPKEEIEKIKSRPQKNRKYRNFPSMNWAMRISFDDYTKVRMPYHEYLEEAEKLPNESRDGFMDKIKVAISEPELNWCFKYVAMDIGDDEAIYILTKMRKSLLDCKDDGVIAPNEMQAKIQKVEELLKFAWQARSYFPGFSSISRVLLHQENEPNFLLDEFYAAFKDEEYDEPDEVLKQIIKKPKSYAFSKDYARQLHDLRERIEQKDLSIKKFLQLCLLNLKPFQFKRIFKGQLIIENDWVRNFDDEVKRSHQTKDILENPYLLYEDYDWYDLHDDVYGEELDAPIDLFKIDMAFFPDTRFMPRIELQRKMKFTDKRRIRAVVLRHLQTLEQTGDCFAQADKLQAAISDYPLYYEIGDKYSLPDNFFYPLKEKYANHFQKDSDKISLREANDTTYYYLSEIYEAEKNIEHKILHLLNAPMHDESFPNLEKYLTKSVDTLKKSIGSNFDEIGFREERTKLYDSIFKKRFFVSAGNAGSGKSYEILKIISHLWEVESQKYLLLAPTGKAALRLSSDSEFPNIKASTIDKFIADVTYGKIRPDQVRQYQNIIIDETSMVDLLKFNKLIQLLNFEAPSFKRFILIGDPNQLPAIGYGRVLADIIYFLKSNKQYNQNYIQLETNCRAELKDSSLLELAEAFTSKGELNIELREKFKDKEVQISNGFRSRYWSNKEELYLAIKEEFEHLTKSKNLKGDLGEKLNLILGLDEEGQIIDKKIDIENFQILTPYKGYYSGAIKINDFIQSDFKKNFPLEFRKNIYKKADKLIRTKNYYNRDKLEISNGTLGFIVGKEKFHFESSDGTDSIAFKNIRSAEQEFFELAYAISVHKSQGSGFNHIFLVIPARFGLLSKELIYTALTRTKKSITLFLQDVEKKDTNILEIALGRSFSGSRKTSLMLDKPYRFYDLEPERGVFVQSRIELLIYHLLMKTRERLGKDNFNFVYEQKPIIDGNEVPIKTDFTVYYKGQTWYWEHLGLLGQRKYRRVWQELKKKTYIKAGIWDSVLTTDESNGVNPNKIEQLIDLILSEQVETEDKFNQYSNHHYYLR